ncbi:glycosyltransferase family 2 protein [Pedobacter sp. L105]|uniref:glycosyltransferase family 2 protein n=1 Tax=Pedobacter sp. L105 TaxID=1641871 RepID=UPI00131B1D34|nr:glycosyltransferase family 2 protein [Pedobacter sp. L105]
MSVPNVAVVILNWNGKELLSRFLPSIVRSRYPNLQLIVGDNASSDDSVDFIRSNFPMVSVLVNDQNYGFAEGYNRILQQVDADYYILLNSDVEVPENWIEPVIQVMETNERIAAAQPKIKWQKDKSKFEYAGAAGGFMDSNAFPFCRGRIFDHLETDNGQYDDAKEIFWAGGAAFFIKRKQWEETGGLDPDLFAHMEEIDLCWRLKNLGYQIAYCPGAEVYHVGGATLDAENPYKVFLNFRNNLIIMQKNLPAGEAAWKIAMRMTIDFIALLQFVLKGKFKFARAVNKAHYQFVKSRKRTAAKRGKTQIPYAKLTGVYPSSVVWAYFIKGIKNFSQLKNFQ